MSFTEEFTELLRAGFSGVWVNTVEPEDAIAAMTQASNANRWNLFTWDFRDKLKRRTALNVSGDVPSGVTAVEAATTAASAAQPSGVLAAWPTLCKTVREFTAGQDGINNTVESRNILVLPGWHRKDLCDNTLLQQYLQTLVYEGRLLSNNWTIVIIGSGTEVPKELEQHFTVLRYSLPTVEELRTIIDIVDEPEPELSRFAKLTPERQQQVLGAARGLTRMQAENAFALSVLRRKQFEPDVIWDLKVESVERSGMLKVYRGDADLRNIGGLEMLKTFTQKLLRQRPSDSKLFPKGLLLAGLPGCGKSQIVKALGSAVNRPVLMFDIGAAMGSLVGETEAGIRRALEIADAMQPCILMVD